MYYTAIEFREQDTRILSTISTNDLVTPLEIHEDESLVEAIVSCDQRKLVSFFSKLKLLAAKGRGRYLIALPASIVSMNCATGDYDQSIDLDETLVHY